MIRYTVIMIMVYMVVVYSSSRYVGITLIYLRGTVITHTYNTMTGLHDVQDDVLSGTRVIAVVYSR